MNIIYSPKYEIQVDHHPWHTSKYRLTLESLGFQGILPNLRTIEAPEVTDADILRAHSAEYLQKLNDLDFTEDEQHQAEIPLTHKVVELFRLMTGGTVLAGEEALAGGIGVHIGGGFHHAYRGHASGFCLLNDIAIGLCVLLDRSAIQSAVVVDCDLHQGDGTACIFHGDPRVFTLSLHQQDAFPFFKQASDLDAGLPAGIGDGVYLAELDKALAALFAGGRRFDLLHYQAGVDTFSHDLLGRLRLSEKGLRERDRRVIAAARSRGIPLVITLGGGYTADPRDVARLHANTVGEAFAAYQQQGPKEK